MPRKKTREEFIADAKAVHGNRYDYSKVEYVNSQTKVIIVCDQHKEFQQTPTAHIGQKQGCPYCAGRKVHLDNCLETCHPDIASQWHNEKNGDVSPKTIVSRTNTHYWWKCPVADDHEWQDSPDHRVRNKKRSPNTNGCPFCSRQRIAAVGSKKLAGGSNCLATVCPEIASEWHDTKNGELTPFDIAPKSGTLVWWKCPIADDHEWEARPCDRVNGSKCPCCCNQKAVTSNCLATTHPHLLTKWDYEKNLIKPTEIVAGSNVKVWWKCSVADDHRWRASIYRMSNTEEGCPCCYGIKIVKSNSLATQYPEIASEWHSAKNGDLTPNDVFSGGKQKIWWKCKNNHEWLIEIKNRINGNGCPICAISIRGESNKLSQDEFIAMCRAVHGDRYDYSKVNYKSIHHKVTIVCKKHGEFRQTANGHGRGAGCPICNESKGERAIRLCLEDRQIAFCPQFNFKNSEIARYRFDFALLHGSGRVESVIEFHGGQHYYPYDFGSKKISTSVQGLTKNILRDLKKERWCKEHNIPLLVIPYWDLDRIPEILDCFIDEQEVINSEPPSVVVKYQALRKHILDGIFSESSKKMETNLYR